MNLTAIRALVEHVTVEDLEAAERAILDGRSPQIDVPGTDDGERLTNVLGAQWVRSHMYKTGADVTDSIRSYANMVRSSIG